MAKLEKRIPIEVGRRCTKCACSTEDCVNHYDHADFLEPVKVLLDSDTKVLAMDQAIVVTSRHTFSRYHQVPEPDFEIRPYRRYHRRRYLVGNKPASHYELYVPHDAKMGADGFYYTARGRVNYKADDPHPMAGKVYKRVPTTTLSSLSPRETIYYRNEENEWVEGIVMEYENHKTVKRAIERFNRRRRAKQRMFREQKSVYQFIEETE